jgi:hypothetical protein
LAFVCDGAEGGIYFSEQQFVAAGNGDDEVALRHHNPQQTVAKFGEFIRNFQEDRTTNIFPYAYVNILSGNTSSSVVSHLTFLPAEINLLGTKTC